MKVGGGDLLDYQTILDQLVSGKLKQYRVKAKNAFAFQAALRNFGKRQEITGRAERGGDIVYTGANSDD